MTRSLGRRWTAALLVVVLSFALANAQAPAEVHVGGLFAMAYGSVRERASHFRLAFDSKSLLERSTSDLPSCRLSSLLCTSFSLTLSLLALRSTPSKTISSSTLNRSD